MKKIILSAAVLSVSVSTWAQVRLTLEDCREMAQQNNAALKNAELDERAAWLQRQEALALYFPTASFSAYAFHALHPMLSIGITDILGKNDFAYNPARINVGSIARMKQDIKGIISPMYICFKCNEKTGE